MPSRDRGRQSQIWGICVSLYKQLKGKERKEDEERDIEQDCEFRDYLVNCCAQHVLYAELHEGVEVREFKSLRSLMV